MVMNKHQYKWENGRPVGPSPQEHITGGRCVICGELFQGLHLRSKTTCSAACRKALSRLPGKIDSAFIRGLDVVEILAGVQHIEELRQSARGALTTLRDSINEALDE